MTAGKGGGGATEIRAERVEKVGDVLSEGQEVKVKVLEIDQCGKVRLSMRVVDQETGAELEDTRPPEKAARIAAIGAAIGTIAPAATTTAPPARKAASRNSLPPS